jgi:hypothetical protein
MAVQHQPGELHKETHPEKDVELDEALVYLVDREHPLDLSISSQKLVHLPAELLIDCPGKCDVSKFSDSDDNRKDRCENVVGNMREAVL